MCGIAGWFSGNNIDASEIHSLRKMLKSIHHRGPDGAGALIDDRAALAHARLAIIDLQSGSQPMLSLDEQCWITFNGEIYNYKDLREDLIGSGCKFKSTSDTEVILNLYKKEGVQGFSRLRGMYAFAIWDKRSGKGILARDPVGIKPLFYYISDKQELAFASEAKAILTRHRDCATLNKNALHMLMNFRYLPAQDSLFEGIVQLKPGSVLEWNRNGDIRNFSIEKYRDKSFDNPMDAIRDSIQSHLVADVEVGSYLSGGIDSAAIARMASECTDSRIRTYTLNIGDDPNEAINAAETASLFNLENKVADFDVNIVESLPRLLWHLEVPKINALQVSENARFASEDVKVILSGMGGDELFLGYNLHSWMYLSEAASQCLPGFVASSFSTMGLKAISKCALPVWSEQERALRVILDLDNAPRSYGLFRNVWDSPYLREQIYGPRMLETRLDNAFELIDENWPTGKDPVMSAAMFEWQHKLVNDLLWQEDRCSMAYGLEVRVPFLDPVVINSVAGLSRQVLMPWGRKKAYFKTLLAGTLPAQILNRKKSGFQLDAATFFSEKLTEMKGYLLSEEMTKNIGLFNPVFINSLLNLKSSKIHRWHYFMLYMIMMVHLWIEIFEKRKGESYTF